MRKFAYLLTLCLASVTSAQEDCNLQYDGNGDGMVNIVDVLGLLEEFGTVCEPAIEDGPCGSESTVSYQGYTYSLVEIEGQCWFAENLRTEVYANGDSIPADLSDSEWSSTTSGATAVYGEGTSSCTSNAPDGDACDAEWSLNAYGRLYNWYAVDDERELCPNGWHVPTDVEWMTLEIALGMSEAQANETGYRGTDQGAQMKTESGWVNSGNGSNASGFSGLPCGIRGNNGSFFVAGSYGYWWSSSPQNTYAWFRNLYTSNATVYRNSNFNRRGGFSVRCTLDP